VGEIRKMKKLNLRQKSFGCGFMLQNYEAIYTKDVKEAVLEFEKLFVEYINIMNNNIYLESHIKIRKEVEDWAKLNNIKYDNFNKVIMGYVLNVKFKEIFGDFEK
jgi:hypothetical protein